MTALPAMILPPLGSATGGNNGTAGLAKTAEEKMIVAAENKREKLPANLMFAKRFFNDIFKERSDLSFELLIKTNTGFFRNQNFPKAL